MTRQGLDARLALLRAGREDGQIGVLILGMAAISLTLILSVVSVTSVQLSRIHLLDAADAAALDAADSIAQEQLYESGLGSGVPLTDSAVRVAAAEHLSSVPLPPQVSSWGVAPGTGSPDGRTAVVRVQGVAHLPIITSVLDQFGSGVSVTVESRARSDLDE
ncbi:pilus assembly protein TadG-related protein [Ornithinimicrobium sp. INDO-MA30-4]|uniref:pilus assembly protein TadG-related protein n=1 Tax=Ornithinimicrobium sp. INDO-MA30-4 TaxID=2908651 RepID=UPI001F39F730|nr:pilus assembly protein TadG-related protein [Ornithinimicrobium sp. INDO-MA30-4]UJH70771.1 hypothetical protein L0A91_01620 [Ornithinimicrobium sp. INDO-MA30-4]